MDHKTADRMTHEELIHAFQSCTLPNDRFRHKEHVRVAWLYLRQLPYDRAALAMEQSVRRYAAHNGALQKYHHTITLLWMRLVASAMAADNRDDFESFLRSHPDLLDKNTSLRFYSAARLDDPAARTGWVEPDLSPLPTYNGLDSSTSRA